MVGDQLHVRRKAAASGSVLLVVLCLVAVLSFLVITTAAFSKQHGEMQAARSGVMRARELAEMGVAVAAHPLIKPGDPLLRHRISAVESFEVVLGTEEGRLNLNALLTEQGKPVLERVFSSWGLSPADAQMVVATLMDWTDADDLKIRPDSAEKAEYARLGFPDLPLNRKFYSREEMEMVACAGMIEKVRLDWTSFFTLRGSGKLDLNTATAEAIAAATGASLENAGHLVQSRQGPDGTPYTSDDTPLQSLEEALALLGLAGDQAENVKPLLALSGTMPRIESIGQAGEVRQRITVVIEKGAGAQQIAEWRCSAVQRTSAF